MPDPAGPRSEGAGFAVAGSVKVASIRTTAATGVPRRVAGSKRKKSAARARRARERLFAARSARGTHSTVRVDGDDEGDRGVSMRTLRIRQVRARERRWNHRNSGVLGPGRRETAWTRTSWRRCRGRLLVARPSAPAWRVRAPKSERTRSVLSNRFLRALSTAYFLRAIFQRRGRADRAAPRTFSTQTRTRPSRGWGLRKDARKALARAFSV